MSILAATGIVLVVCLVLLTIICILPTRREPSSARKDRASNSASTE